MGQAHLNIYVQRANKGERIWGEAQPIYGRQPSKAELWVKHLQFVPTKRRGAQELVDYQ